MHTSMSKSARRALTVASYGGILVLLGLFYLIEHYSRHPGLLIGAGLSLVVIVVSLYYLHIKTGLWKLVHAKTETLDEREIQVVHGAVRQSYALFGVVCLVVIFISVFTYRGNTSFGILLLWGLIYLAHTLPSAIIAWTQEKI